MKTAALLMTLAVSLIAPDLHARHETPTSASSADRVAKWNEDIDFLIKEFPAKHKNAFFKCPQEKWMAEAEAIRGKVPNLRDEYVAVELRRLVAMIGDGHSGVFIGRDATVPASRAYPIGTTWLSDGVFAPIMPKEHEGLIGQRLVRVGTKSIDEAINLVATVRANDNESGRKNSVMGDIRDVDTLVHLGIVADESHADFTFADASGKETTVTLAPVPPGTDWTKLVEQRPDPSAYPAWRSMRRFPYGHEMMEDSKTFYIWYDTCSNHKDKTVQAFTEETIAALDAALAQKPGAPDRVVIDFRRNGGGNSGLFMSMIEQLARREALKEKGRLFGLIGRRTFSSGMMNAYQLRGATKCLLVGEPTGGTPNGYGEVRTFLLPNSKMTVQYSTKLWRGVKEETDAIYPDVAVEGDSKSYFEGRDVVLERVIDWKP